MRIVPLPDSTLLLMEPFSFCQAAASLIVASLNQKCGKTLSFSGSVTLNSESISLCAAEDEGKISDRNHSNGVGCKRALQQACQSRRCHSNIHTGPVIHFSARRGRQKFCTPRLIGQIQNKRLEPDGPGSPAFSICAGMVFLGLMESRAQFRQVLFPRPACSCQ